MSIEIYNTDLRESSLMPPNHRYHHCPSQVIIIVSHLPITKNDLYHQSSPSQVIIIVSHLPTIETTFIINQQRHHPCFLKKLSLPFIALQLPISVPRSIKNSKN